MFQITLKAARVNAGLTQKQAATALGVSNCTLLNWEKGISMPKANHIDAICDLYKVTYDMLIFLPS
jgi:transcriptional regulator with XRE-family HTH domain